mmetsp:Transcript_15453/g.43804  ORF Transcript_15453/g.43804 Transcript_15453/m.43804 type:complete len:299 (-) Transcript_15453:49-945(-)
MGVQVVIRFTAFVVWWLLTLPVMYLFIVLRPIHILLRRLGVPNGRLPIDIMVQYQNKFSLALVGITTSIVNHGVNEEEIVRTTLVVMPNHSSSLDPFILASSLPGAPKYLFKKELIYNPIGLLLYFYGHEPINRKNRESAIRSIDRIAKKMKQYGRSVVIFPEGTRSSDGSILPFKKGGFHLASQSGTSIIPILLMRPHELFPPKAKIPRPGHIEIHLLPIHRVRENEDVNELLEKVHQKMQTTHQILLKNRSSESGQAAAFGGIWFPVAFLVVGVPLLYYVFGLWQSLFLYLLSFVV